MVLMLVGVAMALAGDLDGWAGQPWGSTVGGPKDPKAARVFPPGQGAVAEMVTSRRAAGLFLDQTFLGVPASPSDVWYVEGGLAEVTFSVPMARTDELIAALTSLMGEPYKETGNRHFQAGNTSVSLGISGLNSTIWVVMVSVPHRVRCLELFSSGCQIARVRDEITGQSNELLDEIRLEQDRAIEESRQQAIEHQEALRQEVAANAAEAERQYALRKAMQEQVRQELATRAACVTVLNGAGLFGRLGGGCKAAKSELDALYFANPELKRPTDTASCVALTLPPDCFQP